jgi:hypothetical protein
MRSSAVSRCIVLFLMIVVLVSASGCAAVVGVFKAGMWVGILLAVVVIGGAMFLFSRFS